MSNENLAVIGCIATLKQIPGADRIRQAEVSCGYVGQWSGVVGMDHNVGDLVTVFLQDAVLPPDPRWAFMEKHRWRVRMARFKGVPSECVIVPLAGFPSYDNNSSAGAALIVGFDQTSQLGVTKYSKPIAPPMAGSALGNFPDFIPKTDEPNFQAVGALLDEIFKDDWVATLKCDGASCTAWNDVITGELRVASRNLELKEFTDSGAGNVYWQTARKYQLYALPYGAALQFEVVGPGIQGNPMGLDQVEGRAFTLYNFQGHVRCGHSQLAYIADLVGIPLAPVVASGSGGGPLSRDELRALAQVSYPNGKPGEGIVLRSWDHRLSTKVINLLYKD